MFSEKAQKQKTDQITAGMFIIGYKGIEQMAEKIACLFPGIGYTCDKPLLYYSGKLLKGTGWEVVPVPYSGFPDKVKGDPEKMRLCAETALEQSEEILRGIEWDRYGEILFVGKSVGTVVLGAYAERNGIRCRRILFTPVEAAFVYPAKDAIAFHGTADPWAKTKVIRECCRKQGIPLYETEGANHSLETGDVEKDIRELRKVMRIFGGFAGEYDKTNKTIRT